MSTTPDAISSSAAPRMSLVIPCYNEARNLPLLADYRRLAADAGCTPAQLALAWLLQQGDDILPIPGTRTVEHLHENLGAADVRLSADVLAELDALINPATVSGHRYAEQARREVDTEDFAEK